MMVNAFQTVVVVVAVAGIALSFTRHLWPFDAIRDLGRIGSFFEHAEDRTLEEHPDGNSNDPPIPRRRLRGRL
jgi:hypothetical protein